MYGEVTIRIKWNEFDFYSFEDYPLADIIEAVKKSHAEWTEENPTHWEDMANED